MFSPEIGYCTGVKILVGSPFAEWSNRFSAMMSTSGVRHSDSFFHASTSFLHPGQRHSLPSASCSSSKNAAKQSTNVGKGTVVGMGSSSEVNGSNLVDTNSHSLHVMRDLSSPVTLRDTNPSCREKCPAHVSAATSASGRPAASTSGTYGFFLMVHVSSSNPSSQNDMNSCESCCPYPWKLGVLNSTMRLMSNGDTDARLPDHSAFTRAAWEKAYLPS